MSKVIRCLLVGFTIAAMAGLGLLALVVSRGVSARTEPSRLEAFVARRVRHLAIPAGARSLDNPLPESEATRSEGLAHFADHCAVCHANDGSGDTVFGRGLYPPPPDLRLEATQSLSDGELFYIIEHGIRFTGMPAFGDGSDESARETWGLVQFIRHLPALSADELARMRSLNPKTPAEVQEEEAIRRFLAGEDPGPSPSGHPH